MGLTGYQDWQRVSFANGYSILDISTFVEVARTDGPFNVQAWEAISIFLFAPGGSDFYQVNFNWYADSQGLNLLANQFCVVGPNSLFEGSIPVQGPYLSVQTVPKAGNNAAVVLFTFYGVLSQFTTFDLGLFSGGLQGDSSAYAISQVKTFQPTAIFYGRAKLVVASVGQIISSVVLNFYLWSSGAFVPYCWFSQTGANATRSEEVFLPCAPMQVVVKNGTTAQTINTSLTPMPK